MSPRHLRSIASLSVSLFILVAQPAAAIVRLGPEEPVDTTVTDSLEGFWSADRPALIQQTFAVPSRGGALLLHRSNYSAFASQRLSGTFEFSPARSLGTVLGGTLRVIRAVADNEGMFVLAERYATTTERDLYALRLDSDGVSRAADATLVVRITTAALDRMEAACAADACTIVAFDAPSTLQVIRVPSSGAVTSRTLTVTAPGYARPLIASNGSSSIVSLIRDANVVQLIPLSASGEPGPARLLDVYTSNTPRLAHDGHSFVLQYVRSTSGAPSSWEVRARRLRDDASDFSPSRDVLLGTTATFGAYSMFRDGNALRWILGPATMTGPAQTATLDYADVLSPVIPWLERSTLPLEYSDTVMAATAGPLVFQRRVLSVSDGVSRVEIPTIAQVYAPGRARTHVAPGEPARQRSPRLVRQGSNVRVVWAESRQDIGELYARTLLPDATLSRTEKLPLNTGTLRVGCFDALSVGNDLFVVWQNNLGTYGAPGAARIRSVGSVLRYGELDTLPVYQGTDRCPQFFSVGGRAHWVQNASRTISLGAEVGSTYFDSRGSLFGERGEYPEYVAGFVSGAELEVHWNSSLVSHRARVATTIARPTVAIENSNVRFGDPVRIIEHGDRTRLAVWRDGGWRAQRFDASGPIDTSRAIDAVPIALAAAPNTVTNLDRSSLELASDRGSFYVALVVATGMTAPSKTLEIIRIAKDGAANIERTTVLPATSDVEGFSMLVEAEGRLRVAYGRRDEMMGVARVFTREVSFDDTLVEQGQSCARNAQCRSGACVDGVCCASACAGVGALCGVCSAARGAPADGVCAQVSCNVDPPSDAGADASSDTGADASSDAGVPVDVVVEDVQRADVSRSDVASDRGVASDASLDVASPDASRLDPRLGGGCQCATSVTHTNSRGAGSWIAMGAALVLVARRKRR